MITSRASSGCCNLFHEIADSVSGGSLRISVGAWQVRQRHDGTCTLLIAPADSLPLTDLPFLFDPAASYCDLYAHRR